MFSTARPQATRRSPARSHELPANTSHGGTNVICSHPLPRPQAEGQAPHTPTTDGKRWAGHAVSINEPTIRKEMNVAVFGTSYAVTAA